MYLVNERVYSKANLVEWFNRYGNKARFNNANEWFAFMVCKGLMHKIA